MKIIKLLSVYISAALCFIAITQKSRAALLISNLQISEKEFSVTFAGTIPTEESPDTFLRGIVVINPNQFENPGFNIGSIGTDSSTSSFSGIQTASGAILGNPYYGDYLLLTFNPDLSNGVSLLGTYTATFSSAAFNPSAVDKLDFYWGGSGSFAEPSDNVGGVFLGTATVIPEPSSALLFGLGALTCAVLRRRKT